MDWLDSDNDGKVRRRSVPAAARAPAEPLSPRAVGLVMRSLNNGASFQISIEEFLKGMEQITEGMSVSDLVTRVESLMNR